jgi:hypothetical protein
VFAVSSKTFRLVIKFIKTSFFGSKGGAYPSGKHCIRELFRLHCRERGNEINRYIERKRERGNEINRCIEREGEKERKRKREGEKEKETDTMREGEKERKW